MEITLRIASILFPIFAIVVGGYLYARRHAPEMTVRCAFLELMAPSLPEAVDALVQAGHTAIRIVPLFLGMGRHAREDLPQLCAALQQRHPQLLLDVQAAVGEQAELIRCLAQIALAPSKP